MERELLSTPDTGPAWPSELPRLLDGYLGKVGIVSAETRSHWVAHVLAQMQLHITEFAPDDIVEQAVERLRGAIEARLGMIASLDPIRDGREIAAILVVLQNSGNADLVNALFADCAAEVSPGMREQLRHAVAAERPRPVPEEAPVQVPVQLIELRSMNLLSRLFGAFR